MHTDFLGGTVNVAPRLGNICVHVVTIESTLRLIEGAVTNRTRLRIHTLNADHIAQAERNAELLEAVTSADMVVPDGMPVVWAMRRAGARSAVRVTGSDLMMAVLERCRVRVALLGGAPGVAEQARQYSMEANHRAEIVLTLAPTREEVLTDATAIVRKVNSSGADVLFVAFGAPLQEVWLRKHEDELEVPVRAGVGAAIDFLAKERRRAPTWMQDVGLEWAYRLCLEPRRLAGRYILRDWRALFLLAEKNGTQQAGENDICGK